MKEMVRKRPERRNAAIRHGIEGVDTTARKEKGSENPPSLHNPGQFRAGGKGIRIRELVAQRWPGMRIER